MLSNDHVSRAQYYMKLKSRHSRPRLRDRLSSASSNLPSITDVPNPAVNAAGSVLSCREQRSRKDTSDGME